MWFSLILWVYEKSKSVWTTNKFKLNNVIYQTDCNTTIFITCFSTCTVYYWALTICIFTLYAIRVQYLLDKALQLINIYLFVLHLNGWAQSKIMNVQLILFIS